MNCVSLFLYSVLPECLTLFSHSLCGGGGGGGGRHACTQTCLHAHVYSLYQTIHNIDLHVVVAHF